MNFRSLFAPAALVLLLASTASSAEISYTQSSFRQGASGSISFSGILPLFDISQPEIPDDAILQAVRFDIQQSLVAILEVAPRPPFSASAVFGFQFDVYSTFPPVGVDEAVVFPFTFPTSNGRYSALFAPSVTVSFTDPNLGYYTPAGNTTSGVVSLQGSAGFSLMGVLPPPDPTPPGIPPWPFGGIINDITDASGTYRITYTYDVPNGPNGVPDGGTTAALLGIVLASLLAVRRW